MRIVDSVHRLLQAIRHYRNPLSIAARRAAGSEMVKVVDRKTGLVFHCRRGGDCMMAETFHALIYDIPFAPIRDGDLVLDIGANHGFYSCWAAKRGAIVHAFEPDPTTYKLLLANIAANGLEDRVFPHSAAIAGESGELPIYCTAEMGGGMSTIIPAFAVGTGMAVTSRPMARALSMADALKLCGASRVRICKMDCEGAEQSILSSLDSSTLQRFDAFVLEYHPQAYDLDEFMEMLLGWKDYHLSKVVSRDGDLGNANLSLVRSDIIREWGRGPQVKDHREAGIQPRRREEREGRREEEKELAVARPK